MLALHWSDESQYNVAWTSNERNWKFIIKVLYIGNMMCTVVAVDEWV